MTSTWLNKIMGCESPRCRRCKCRDGLPLTKVSHWIISEKADRPIAGDMSQKTSQIALPYSSRAMEEGVVFIRRKTAAVVTGNLPPQLFVLCFAVFLPLRYNADGRSLPLRPHFFDHNTIRQKRNDP